MTKMLRALLFLFLIIVNSFSFVFFQVETIGDAYCVAGGLHRKSKYHAQQIAWMGLKMMETAKNELSHDGNVIRVSILIFSLVIRKINIIALTYAVIYLKYFYFCVR